MAYTIPLSTPGSYTVTLKFNEPAKTAANQRKFDVSLEGTLVLDDFDIWAAGGKNVAVDRTFAVTVTDGALNVTFGRVTDNPIISAIEVIWAGSSPATPTVVYTYRADGLRSTKTLTTTGTTTYTWDLNSGLPVVLQDGSQSYVYGLGGIISQTDITGTQTYFLGDGLGSTQKLTDGSGNAFASYGYDIFGESQEWSSYPNATEYRFTGQQEDGSGYLYLRARYYDVYTGRFLSKDPFPGLLTNPASQHYYGYAYNNPVNFTDPSGLWTGGICITGILGLGVYGTASWCPIVVASNGDIGMAFTVGGGGVAIAASGLSAGPQISSGNRLRDLNGPFVTSGASFRALAGGGFDSFVGRNECNELIWGASAAAGLGGNVGPPFPGFEFHGGVTTTDTWGFNVFDFVGSVWQSGGGP